VSCFRRSGSVKRRRWEQTLTLSIDARALKASKEGASLPKQSRAECSEQQVLFKARGYADGVRDNTANDTASVSDLPNATFQDGRVLVKLVCTHVVSINSQQPPQIPHAAAILK
jgi:hypothetical protein